MTSKERAGEVVDDDVVHQHLDALGLERDEEAGVDVGGDDREGSLVSPANQRAIEPEPAPTSRHRAPGATPPHGARRC